MSVTNGVNLSSGLPGQSATQAQPSALPANPAVASGNATLPTDQFVPSSLSETADATAQAAGLFTVSKSASSSSSSDLLSTPPSSSLPAANSTTKTNTATTAIGATAGSSDSAASATSTSSSTGALSGSASPQSSTGEGDSAPATGSAASGANAQGTSTSSTSGSTASSGSVTTQTQLDSLNNALEALGLSAADIQQIDQVAQLTNDFSPTSFTSLVYQLEALARNSSPQTQTTPAASTDAGSNHAAEHPANAVSGSNGATNAGARARAQNTSDGGSSLNGKNFSLQGVQLQLNFTSGSGQTVQVQTPVLNSNSAPAAAKTQAASA